MLKEKQCMLELIRLATKKKSYFPQIQLDGLLEECACLNHKGSVEWFSLSCSKCTFVDPGKATCVYV